MTPRLSSPCNCASATKRMNTRSNAVPVRKPFLPRSYLLGSFRNGRNTPFSARNSYSRRALARNPKSGPGRSRRMSLPRSMQQMRAAFSNLSPYFGRSQRWLVRLMKKTRIQSRTTQANIGCRNKKQNSATLRPLRMSCCTAMAPPIITMHASMDDSHFNKRNKSFLRDSGSISV